MNIYRNNNPAYFNELVELCNKTQGHGLVGFLNHSKKYLKEWIESQILKLQDKTYNIITKCYWIVNGLEDFPECEVCHKKDNYIGKNVKLSTGYHKTCSTTCGHKLQGKIVSTILSRKSLDEKKNIVDKRKQTCIEKYGVDNPQKCKTIIQKSKSTRLEKNNGNYFNSASIDKMKSTKLKKYGSLNNYSKIRNTVFKRYSVENIGQHKETRDKVKKTCVERYGEECTFKSKQIQKKIKQTCIEKYGTDNVLKLSMFHEKAKIVKKTDSYNKFILNCEYDEPMFTLKEYLSRKSDHDLLEFRCKKCGKKFKAVHEDGMHKHCEYCYPSLISQLTSEKEKQLISFIENECNVEVLKNSKSIIPPLELDVYVSEKNIAFEFDGLYWHNEKNKPDKNYHLHKTEECEKKGIQLIHIFENEWLYKQEIVKSRIKNLFGIYDKILFARKCEVREVDNKTSKQFQEDNHIQGSVNSRVNLGLYFNNELVSLMTFGKCRFDKHHEWELLRFCNKSGYHIPGAASKLLKYFERTYQPKSLVSYADRRWSQGKVYKKLGFKLNHTSKPDYWYVVGNQLKSRVNFQKHKLNKILKIYDNNLTEVENMHVNGYYRIFDCGNIVFEKLY